MMTLAARIHNLIGAQAQRLAGDDRGQGMVEYGLIIALVAIAAIAGLRLLSGGLGSTFSQITTSL